MQFTAKISKNNNYSFLWHATFLALAQNFMDINTIIPARVIDASGKAVHIGIFTEIYTEGGIIHQFRFNTFFILFINILIVSFYYILKRDCKQ